MQCFLFRAVRQDPFSPQLPQPLPQALPSSIYSGFGLRAPPAAVPAAVRPILNSNGIQSSPAMKKAKTPAKASQLGPGGDSMLDDDDAPLSLFRNRQAGKTAVRLVAPQLYLQACLGAQALSPRSLFFLHLPFF